MRVARGIALVVGSLAVLAVLGAAAFEVVAGAGWPLARVPAGLALVAFAGVLGWAFTRDDDHPTVTTAAPKPAAAEPLGFAGVPDPELEALVTRAVAEIPQEFREQIANLAFVIEEEPPPGKNWLATYQGIPLTQKSVLRPWDWPHKITIYRGPLRRLYGHDPALFEREVTHTVRHELAHYFGISDERLVELGAY